jgi:hypothetical protein
MSKLKVNKEEQALIDSLDIGTENEVIKNPYTGHSIELDPTAVALHDFIKGCEMLELYEKMSLALGIFRQNYPDAYMVLLD